MSVRMTLHQPLKGAIDAALAAGEMIRREYYRQAGPRGAGSHADVDKEAEQLIRERLTTAYPAWDFTGEETGEYRGDTAEFHWFVDPNDGTSAFLDGYR